MSGVACVLLVSDVISQRAVTRTAVESANSVEVWTRWCEQGKSIQSRERHQFLDGCSSDGTASSQNNRCNHMYDVTFEAGFVDVAVSVQSCSSSMRRRDTCEVRKEEFRVPLQRVPPHACWNRLWNLLLRGGAPRETDHGIPHTWNCGSRVVCGTCKEAYGVVPEKLLANKKAWAQLR